eukprot:GFUD01029838.1.p1 GENE.GFUD01029838.1~~GFUD01029838.1.p1  ORF type:complete len:798 (-),score=306.47 GFUD01029838.1:498-2891(-)
MGKKSKNKTKEVGGTPAVEDEKPESPVPVKKLEEQNLDDDEDEEVKDDGEGDEDEEVKDDGEGDEDEEVKEEKVKSKKTDEAVIAKKPKSGAKDQKNYISSLKDKDPEFFEFLKENDEELLNFDESSDEEERGDKEEGAHQAPDKLEVNSDESDFEDEDAEKSEASGSRKKLNQAQIDTWLENLKQPNLTIIQDIIEGFKGAVAAIGSGEKTEESAPIKYIVEGGTLFNSVVRLCVVNLQPALRTFLKLEPDSHMRPEKAKKWKKLERHVRVYLMELVTLLSRVNEQSVQCVLLKHIHSMLPYYQAFQKGAKQMMIRLINIWSAGSETPRILAFMCLVKLVRNSPLLEPCIKAMYLAYVKNCKFTSPSTLPSISFMKRSLVEMLGLDHNLAYYQAFVYIRQLAIHLRNAITTDKADSVLAVYNWQFIHSLELWGALLGHTGSSEAMKPLIYPLVQVVIGASKLVPTPKYYPLRFHCAKILREVSSNTGTFIPVLPFYLEVLNSYNFGKKSKKVSMKPIDFSCILKLSASQLLENGFKDATVEEIYGGILSYLADNSNKIGFPELVTPLIFQLKDFLKKCKVSNYTKKIKTILDKTVANQKFIETRRKPVTFGVGDAQKIQVWETQVARDGTPLLAFYKSWKKVSDIQHAKKVSGQEKMDDYSHIPLLKKNHKKIRMKMEASDEVTGFLSGSDDDDFDEEENFKLKEERGMKRKNKGASDDESEDDTSNEKKSKPSEKTEKAVDDDESDIDDDPDGDDEVEDLKLEDLDSGSDIEMNDEFDGADSGKDDSSGEESDDE